MPASEFTTVAAGPQTVTVPGFPGIAFEPRDDGGWNVRSAEAAVSLSSGTPPRMNVLKSSESGSLTPARLAVMVEARLPGVRLARLRIEPAGRWQLQFEGNDRYLDIDVSEEILRDVIASELLVVERIVDKWTDPAGR
jgi:hypothetical protein